MIWDAALGLPESSVDKVRTVIAASPRRGRPSNWEGRAAEVLDAAARTLNAEGLTNASLDSVARSLRITKSALYYYFGSKEDLVFKCYLRSCQLACEAVEDALRQPGTGRERLAYYIRRLISPSNPPIAFVGEIEFLEAAHRDELRVLVHRHHQALVDLLESGAADGSLSVLNSNLLVYALKGAMNWIPVWLKPGGTLSLEVIADAFVDLFFSGLSPLDRKADRAHLVPVSFSSPPPASLFDREQQSSQRRELLIRQSSEFFNRNGFDNCTLDDIARGLDVSRSALYHYVSSKEELLYASIVRSLKNTEVVVNTIVSEGGDGLTRIIRTICSAAELHAGPAGPIANYTSLKSLSLDHAREVQVRSKNIQSHLASFFDLGVEDGSIRPVNVRIARLALLGSINRLNKWWPQAVPADTSDVSDNLIHLFVDGLSPRRG